MRAQQRTQSRLFRTRQERRTHESKKKKGEKSSGLNLSHLPAENDQRRLVEDILLRVSESNVTFCMHTIAQQQQFILNTVIYGGGCTFKHQSRKAQCLTFGAIVHFPNSVRVTLVGRLDIEGEKFWMFQQTFRFQTQ